MEYYNRTRNGIKYNIGCTKCNNAYYDMIILIHDLWGTTTPADERPY